MSTATQPKRLEHGRWLVQLPLPGHSIGHVNVLVIAHGDSTTLIDTGWGHEANWECLSMALAEVGLSIESVRRIVTTHYHADHCGMSRLFQERTHAQVVMHVSDTACLDDRYFTRTPYIEETMQWVRRVGAPDFIAEDCRVTIETLSGHVIPFTPNAALTNSLTQIADEDLDLMLIHTPGHTAGHICIYEPSTGILSTGDTLFAKINTNPVLRPHAPSDPVGSYLDSLNRLEALDACVVIPGHLEPFDDLHGRIGSIRAYHQERLKELLEILSKGAATAWEVAGQVTRRRPWPHLSPGARTTATGETFAHLRRLELKGKVRTRNENPILWSLA